ncbi:MOSC domain-containing protein [Bacillus timonensis]|nr:MOSC domain-containing protein [Bacillus timonensis]
MLIGHLQEITRHPVKSFTGETVNKTRVMKYGLYGDRSHALLDQSRDNKFLTITQAADFVKYKARFMGEELDDELPMVEITNPAGKTYRWAEAAFVDEIEQLTLRKVTPIQFAATEVPLGGALEEDHLLLATDASLQQLEEMTGFDVDKRRFRPNLFLSLVEKKPFVEEEWVGKQLQIGDNVIVRLNKPCVRCSIVNVEPESAKITPSVLKTVVTKRESNFGVYASVVKTGVIQNGDEVHLVD